MHKIRSAGRTILAAVGPAVPGANSLWFRHALGRALMAKKISLKRFGTMPLVPVPRAVRAGDYIFTSSLYPVDESGRVVGLDAARDEVRPSLMEIQARQCLESLKKVFAEAGGSMERVLKADVHLVDPADFYEFKLVWNEYFPSNPPARTTVEIGDTLPFHGARLNIDAVALASDSSFKREVLSDPEGADPIEAEGASHAVRAGNLVFCSEIGRA